MFKTNKNGRCVSVSGVGREFRTLSTLTKVKVKHCENTPKSTGDVSLNVIK